MKKIICLSLIIFVGFVSIAGLSDASEYQGTLNTGLETGVQGIQGTVQNSAESGNNTPASAGSAGSAGGGGGGGGGGVFVPITTATPAGSKTGDIDGDGAIDARDFNRIMVDWGKTGASVASDLNGDGAVDIKDFNTLMVNWGEL